MNILRNIARWLCAFILGAALSFWIVVAVAQSTVLNRTAVKSWLQQSGIYSKNINDMFQLAPVNQTATDVFSGNALQQAFGQTFTAGFIQQSIETVINGTYDWLEGTQPTIHFSIPVQQKADEFSANLARAITPKIAALPRCQNKASIDANGTCIPQGMTAEDYAKLLTVIPADSDFLHKPLTDASFQQNQAPLNWLPQAVQILHTLFWVLPIVIIILGGLYVLLSSQKLTGLGALGRQITLNTMLVFIGGIALWVWGSSVDLHSAVDGGNAQASAALATSYLNPIARTVLPNIGMVLSLYSGAVMLIGIALWLGTYLVRKQRLMSSQRTLKIPPTTSETQNHSI